MPQNVVAFPELATFFAIRGRGDMNDNDQIFAVLTGDVVGSCKLPPGGLNQVMQRPRRGSTQFNDAYPGTVFGTLDVYSGDGWQVLLSRRIHSLRAALYLRAFLKSSGQNACDTRSPSPGAGSSARVSFRPRYPSPGGEAFTRSGRALQGMARHERLSLDTGTLVVAGPFFKPALGLADRLATQWTAAQAYALGVRPARQDAAGDRETSRKGAIDDHSGAGDSGLARCGTTAAGRRESAIGPIKYNYRRNNR